MQQALLLTSKDECPKFAERLSCAERLRADLSRRFHTMIERYEYAEEAIRGLGECIDHGADLTWPGTALSQVFGRWLDEAIRSFEAAGQGIAHAQIDRSELHEDNANPDIDRPDSQVSMRAAADKLIEVYDFERLVEDLDRLSGRLEDKGLREAADRIVCDLGLNADYHREHPPKKTAREWVFSRRIWADGFGGYSYTMREDLTKLMQAFEVVEQDAGFSGLRHAMQEVVTVLGDARDRLPSRTRIGSGNAIEGVVFKEKLELKMSHEVGNGLLAFVVSHTSKPLIEL